MLEVNALAVAAYLNAQIEAGAQAVMLFDTWGGALADGAYQTFSLAYMRKVLAKLKRDHAGERVPSIVFTKGGGLWLERNRRLGLRRGGARLDGQSSAALASESVAAAHCKAISIRWLCLRVERD